MRPTIKLALLSVALAAVTACTSNGAIPGMPLTREQLLDPKTCATCHEEHYTDWAQSMHAYASDDPVFLAMNARAQRETGGTVGNFCVQCHAPMALHEGVTTDGTNLATVDPKLKGITCYFCHNVDDVAGTHNNPLQLADDTTMRGEYSNPVPNQAHRAAYSPFVDRSQLQSSQLCGTCHDVVAPPGGHVERTFAEWQASAFSQAQDGETCSQCHMNASTSPQLIAQAPGAIPRLFHSHQFPAVDVALTPFPGEANQMAQVQNFLNTSLQEALCVKTTGSTAAIRVLLDNVSAGHNWPSGATQDRRAWAEVIAYKNNQVIYESGVIGGANSNDVTQLNDPNLWLMHDCMFDQNGTQVPMFWDAASIESNLLPGQPTFNVNDPNFYNTHIVQFFPRDQNLTIAQVPDKVTLRIRLQPIGLDVLDSLVQSGDLDPNVIAAMPTFDVSPTGTTLTWTAGAAGMSEYIENGTPVQCVSNGVNVTTVKNPAVNHVRCSP